MRGGTRGTRGLRRFRGMPGSARPKILEKTLLEAPRARKPEKTGAEEPRRSSFGAPGPKIIENTCFEEHRKRDFWALGPRMLDDTCFEINWKTWLEALGTMELEKTRKNWARGASRMKFRGTWIVKHRRSCVRESSRHQIRSCARRTSTTLGSKSLRRNRRRSIEEPSETVSNGPASNEQAVTSWPRILCAGSL